MFMQQQQSVSLVTNTFLLIINQQVLYLVLVWYEQSSYIKKSSEVKDLTKMVLAFLPSLLFVSSYIKALILLSSELCLCLLLNRQNNNGMIEDDFSNATSALKVCFNQA